MSETTDTSVKKSLPNQVTIIISGKEIVVHKMGLLAYNGIMQSMKGLIASLCKLVITDWSNLIEGNDLDNDSDPVDSSVQSGKVAEVLVGILTENVTQLIDFLCICLPSEDKKFIELEVGLPDVFTIIEAVLAVNGINQFVGEVKNLISGARQM